MVVVSSYCLIELLFELEMFYSCRIFVGEEEVYLLFASRSYMLSLMSFYLGSITFQLEDTEV